MPILLTFKCSLIFAIWQIVFILQKLKLWIIFGSGYRPLIWRPKSLPGLLQEQSNSIFVKNVQVTNWEISKCYWKVLCYKLIQRFRVTCLIAGQYNTALLWHITGSILTCKRLHGQKRWKTLENHEYKHALLYNELVK